MSDVFQIATILFITLGIVVAVYYRGKANPEDTGVLGRQIGTLGGKVDRFEAQLGEIEKDVARLDGDAASKADIKRMEKALGALQGEVAEIGKSAASREATIDHVKQQVDALYRVIVTKGMS